MKIRIMQSVVAGAMALSVLAACEEGGLSAPPAGGESAAAASQEPRKIVEIREVERPDVFSVSELALWSGRPTFGAVWVAHPDVKDPERVIIKNLTNGQTVSGALYRREVFNPGPRIEVSADAAAALGMLAGQPTELSIVAVRQEEVVTEIAPPPGAEAEEPAEETADASAEAAPAPDAEAGGEALAAAAAVGTAAVAQGEKKPGFWARFSENFKKKPAQPDATIADADAAVATDATAPAVETATLDPVATAAAAAIAAAEADAAAQPAPKATGRAAKGSYVQAGLFTVKANAEAAAASLRQGGIVPLVEEGTGANGPFWRVLVGPIGSASDQNEILAQVKALGYADAYVTAN